MIRALVFDFDGLILEIETPADESWAEMYREHGQELPMDRWHGYIGSDAGFDPAGHLAALVGEGFDRDATQARRDVRKTELIAALDLMVGVPLHRRREAPRIASRHRVELVARLGARPSPATRHRRTVGRGAHAGRCRPDETGTRPVSRRGERAWRRAGESGRVREFDERDRGGERCRMLCVAVPNALTASTDLSRADVKLNSLAETPLEELLAILSRD